MTDLLGSVDLLTRDRIVYTPIRDEDGKWLSLHSEVHPPLLTLLLEGTGQSRGPKSSDEPLPIDADALELWGQVRDLVRLWCKQLRVRWDADDLLGSMRRWFTAHSNKVRAGVTSAATDADVARMVEGWVRMVEGKFDPPRRAEWTGACPNILLAPGPDGSLVSSPCGARRVLSDGVEVFAIQLNVTSGVAKCSSCGRVWEGVAGWSELRFMSNVGDQVAAGVVLDPVVAELATPRQK